MKSFRSLLARGAGLALLIQGGGAALRYLWQMLFARWMGPVDFGSFSFALGWLQILAIVCALGLTTGVLRFVPEYAAKDAWGRLRGIVRRSRQVTFLSGLGIAALGSLVVLALPLRGLDRGALLAGLWLIPLLGLGNLHLEIVRATTDITRAYLPMRVVQPALAILVGWIVWTREGGLSGVQGLGALGVALAVVLLIQHAWVGRALPREARAASPVFETGFWLRESFPLLLIAGFIILLNQTDVIMVGALSGAEAAGVYAAGAVTARLVNFMLLSVNAIAAPLIASLYAQGDASALQDIVTRTVRWSFWPSLVVAGVLFVAGGPILELFGPEFVAARTALWILAAGQVLNASMGPVGHLMNLTGHGNRSARVYGVAAALNIVLDLALIPRLGIEGAAIATTGSLALWNVWLYFQVKRYVGVRSFALLP